MNYQPLKYIYQPSGNPEAYTLLLLHGTGGDETDLIPLAKNFGNNFNILSVRGNVLEHGMPRFFRRIGMGIFDEEDLKFRTHELVNFIKEIASKEGFNSTKLIALGYSNGANIAGSTLVLHPDFLSGAILFRPMLPFKQMPAFQATKKVPVFISSGNLDGMVSMSEIQNYTNLLEANHFNIEQHQLNTGHNLTEEDVALAVKWVHTNFK
ncbi:alpha/beta hydrolase [Mariniflexile litorale]|uniref:Alpha/beta hydrolase n=1 Tax=Mariniflexile litorale TaxID=3045158 RepID=A0AAU7EEE5_9FLAO|nr:alpha/beta hydrolase [Mariniflexile sp. KMM 9835]MDQ8211977.1 alpha/beta hydrolase [Mariniflexile sp. KMM 9835]